MPITCKVWSTGSRQSCTTGKHSFTAESHAVLWAVFQCQVEPCFCLGSYRRSRNLTECMCVQMSHVWASETAPPFPPLSRCTVSWLPGEIEPSGLNIYIPVSQPDSTAFPCTVVCQLYARGCCFGTYRWLSNSGVPYVGCFPPKT